MPFFGWQYPPLFLIVAASLALLPYAGALLVWMGTTLAACLFVVRAIVPRDETVLLALAFPALPARRRARVRHSSRFVRRSL